MATGSDGPVAIAVSGGSDSLGLMLLAHRWASARSRKLVVLTVDHRMRAESAAEVAHVCKLANELGLEARPLACAVPPTSQSEARQARHRLLATAAGEAGTGLLLIGHTRSDVEETFLMRLRRGSSLTRAAAPSPLSVSPVWPEGRGLTLARPLLGQRRSEIQSWLTENKIGWFTDPSNDSVSYERGRVRRDLRSLTSGHALAKIIDDAAALRALEDRKLADDIRKHVAVDAAGLVQIQSMPERQSSVLRLVSTVVLAASGGDTPVEQSKLMAALAEFDGMATGHRFTLGGAWLQKTGGGLLIGRDPGAVQARWSDGLWDGRYVMQGGSGFQPDTAPYLVRHAVPTEGYWREVISGRLHHLAETLERSAKMQSALQA